MAWPAVLVVGGGEAFVASQPATGSRSTRHDWRWFGRLEQEDQRLKKHYGRWMDIVRSLELESFILTKLTKHFKHEVETLKDHANRHLGLSKRKILADAYPWSPAEWEKRA